MDNQLLPRGWQLHHHEQLFIHANSGAPTIRLKFYHYPSYRQTVIINQPPVRLQAEKQKGQHVLPLPTKGSDESNNLP